MLEPAFDLYLAQLSYTVVPLKHGLSSADSLWKQESHCLEMGLQDLGDLRLCKERHKAHRKTQDNMRFPLLLLCCETNTNSVYSEKKMVVNSVSLEATAQSFLRASHTRVIQTQWGAGWHQRHCHTLQFLEEVVSWTFCLGGCQAERGLSRSRWLCLAGRHSRSGQTYVSKEEGTDFSGKSWSTAEPRGVIDNC